MLAGKIEQKNVGRIAEKIVAIELEYRGFHVTDLNKDGVKANADLLAAKGGHTWQIQVKGASGDGDWWFNYGHCTEEQIIGEQPFFFNKVDAFYKAQVVILVCVQSPISYKCIVMPVLEAEKAAQLNLSLFREKKKDGSAKKPGRMWCDLNHIPNTKNANRQKTVQQEQALIQAHEGKWDLFDSFAIVDN